MEDSQIARVATGLLERIPSMCGEKIEVRKVKDSDVSSSSSSKSSSSSSSSSSAKEIAFCWKRFVAGLESGDVYVEVRDNEFETKRMETGECTKAMFQHSLEGGMGECGNEEGVHVVLISPHCIDDVGRETASFEAPEALRSVLDEKGCCNFTRVLTREEMRSLSVDRQSMVDCIPAAAQYGTYTKLAFGGNNTDLLLRLEPKLMPSKGYGLLLRTAYMFSNADVPEEAPWESEGCALLLPPAVATTFIRSKDGCYRHLTGVCAHVQTTDRKYVEMHDVTHDPIDSNDAQAVFRALQTDASRALLHVPDSHWIVYYAKHPRQVPISNYWRVYHRDSSQRSVTMKQGAVVKSIAFFELLVRNCLRSDLTQHEFLVALEDHLLHVSSKLQSPDLVKMTTSWMHANMLVASMETHIPFVRVFNRVDGTIRSYIESQRWPEVTPPDHTKAPSLETAMQRLLSSLSPSEPARVLVAPMAPAKVPPATEQTLALSQQLEGITKLLEVIISKM